MTRSSTSATCRTSAVAAAAAAAATALDLRAPGEDKFERFAAVDAAVRDYLARDPSRRTMHIVATLSDDRTTLTLYCAQSRPLAFGAAFGLRTVRHTARSSARARLS